MTSRATVDTYKLQVQNLRKTFGAFVALSGANLNIAEGEFLTLLGPSGSGKTTLLLAIAGLNEPDGGEVWIDGKLATYLPPYKRDIGMVFQNYALFPHMTIYDNIAFPLRMRRRNSGEIREAVDRMLEVVRLPHIADRLPGQLSGGQQQRVALARALVYEPSIVLMDEPLGALDKKLRDQLQLEIKYLHEQLGIAVLYVTHDQEEALVMSDRICLMRDGNIEQLGSPDDLYFRPHSLFAADFLGESNILRAHLERVEGDRGIVRLASGDVARGYYNGGLASGAEVRVMVRPESLYVINGEARSEATQNVVRARFTDRVMTGGTTKHFFQMGSGEKISVQTLTAGPISQAPVFGEVSLGWSSEHCVILPEE